MTPAEALDAIRECQARSELGWTDHVWERMQERDISARQVMDVIAGGRIETGPSWSDEHDDWVCVMRKSVAGQDVHVVIGIQSEVSQVAIITVY